MMNRGFILPAVIVIGGIIASFALSIAGFHFSSYQRAIKGWDRLKYMQSAQSGLEIGRNRLELDSNKIDGPGDDWYRPITLNVNDTEVSVIITDEMSKINLNRLLFPSGEINQPLFMVLKRLYKSISKEEINRIFQQKNRFNPVFQSSGMIHLLPGTNNFRDAGKTFTVVGDGRININTAERNILGALAGYNGSEFADKVVRSRTDKMFSSFFDFQRRTGLEMKNTHGLMPILRVNSSYFRIQATAGSTTCGAVAEVVVHRTAKSTSVLHYREWWL